MGVEIYLLNRGRVTLEIGGLPKKVGTLRRLSKVSELNKWRREQINACHEAVSGKATPVAVLAWSSEVFPLDAPRVRVDARVVLAWEQGRSTVNDWDADCLPVLGYAVPDRATGRYVLHEVRGGFAVPCSLITAKEKGMIDNWGKLIRRQAPRILKCEAFEVWNDLRSAFAKCLLDDGRIHEIWTAIEPEKVPAADWYIGKKPSEARDFLRST